MSVLDPNEPFLFAEDVPPANTDESKVPEFVLPDPLKTASGIIVDSPQIWTDIQRPEILELFRKNMYGRVPVTAGSEPDFTRTIEVLETDPNALGGKATRTQLKISWSRGEKRGDRQGPSVNLLLYVPNHVNGNVPAFLAYNFEGNHTICNDPGILLPHIWTKSKERPQLVPALESDRGKAQSRWSLDPILEAGYALITAYYCEVVPDFPDGRSLGVQGLFDSDHTSEPSGDSWGAIATWAWGLGQFYDALQEQSGHFGVDLSKVIVMGHSRLGKTALWTGASDPRFAAVISNNSGCGGSALSRREFGETIQQMNIVFPHWLNTHCKQFNRQINNMPIDQHELIALIAPRPVYVASAQRDTWADPRGEFLSCLNANPVYLLLGTEGIGDCREMPGVDEPIGKTIRYHVRRGGHDVTHYDWEQYIRFADETVK